jgi:hypothetical protein
MLANALGENFAPVRQQQFGIAQASDPICRIENNCGGNYWPEQRTAPDFIHARNPLRTRLPHFFFIPESTTQLFEQAQLGGGGRERFGGFGL